MAKLVTTIQPPGHHNVKLYWVKKQNSLYSSGLNIPYKRDQQKNSKTDKSVKDRNLVAIQSTLKY